MTTFVLKDEAGTSIEVVCFSKSTRSGFSHNARAFYNEVRYDAKINYLNRTWESFDFESVLYKIAEKIAGKNKDRYDAFVACIKKRAQDEKEACDAWFNGFKARYEKLSDGAKKMLADSDIMLETQEQAETVMNTCEVLDVVKGLL